MTSENMVAVNGSMIATDKDLAAVEIFNNYPEGLLQFAYVMCVIFTIIGISGNLITIIALAACKKFRNATAVLIINLHIDNLIFCSLVLPMSATIFSSRHWILGRTLCNLYPYLKYSLNCTEHFTIVAITINRYIIICHPHLYHKLQNKRILIISLISTWIVGFTLFLPSFFGLWGKFDLDIITGQCTMLPDKNRFCPKKFFLVLAFAGPYIIFIVCYSRIWWTVKAAALRRIAHNSKRAHPTLTISTSDPLAVEDGIVCAEPSRNERGTDEDNNNTSSTTTSSPTIRTFFHNPFKTAERGSQIYMPTRKDKKLATMIFALMLSFTLCHLPIMLLRIAYSEYNSYAYINVLVHLMAYSSAFLSPLIYVILSSEYRQVYASLYHNIKLRFEK